MKLVIENITKQIKGKVIISPFSTELTEGVYALLGPNGAGKTTLMRMLASISKPSSGRILLDGKDISLLDENYRDQLGYLPQDFGVYQTFNAERFLLYFASLKGLSPVDAKKRVAEVLDLVNLTNERKKKLGTYSGGMKRRLGIAQALLNDPKILIVDEPTAGLDPQERIRFRNLLSDISANRIVLLSTHIVSDIEYIAKEILLLENGQLLQRSTLDNLLTQVEDNVWTAIVTQEELAEVQRSFKLGNIQRQADGISIRIVSPEKPLPQAKNVQATLEDVYLFFFNESEAQSHD
ncbi:ABC-type multidrug transport system ATPase subunit [Alkalihalobacillus xiaoxiensis]|uniref:ABC-type multidrug transport system ATPase subunit n=1 Tax=Shouchella xiaoxiensis TaxID=766895 RepID=A0ABS2SVY6_9BACI|nr:ABC transporter ATP-binding protein [Shouchella xiaoxiensis]MBM7839703.1 ABC-type multidrug transport system ATPase subunit [Shouchella xiaoxiensis]